MCVEEDQSMTKEEMYKQYGVTILGTYLIHRRNCALSNYTYGDLLLRRQQHWINAIINFIRFDWKSDCLLMHYCIALTIREDHASLQRPLGRAGVDATWSLMDIEECPHPMSSAMEVVKTHLPERGSCHGLQTVAIDLGGEDSRAQPDYTLQDTRKALLQREQVSNVLLSVYCTMSTNCCQQPYLVFTPHRPHQICTIPVSSLSHTHNTHTHTHTHTHTQYTHTHTRSHTHTHTHTHTQCIHKCTHTNIPPSATPRA